MDAVPRSFSMVDGSRGLLRVIVVHFISSELSEDHLRNYKHYTAFQLNRQVKGKIHHRDTETQRRMEMVKRRMRNQVTIAVSRFLLFLCVSVVNSCY